MTGWVSQPEHITQIVEIAEQFYPRVLNHMQVGGVQQVKLNVKIMEVQRSKLRRLGMGFLQSNRFSGASVGGLVPGSDFLRTTPGLDLTSATSVAFQMVSGTSALTGVIDALKEEELLKVLAEPTLVTTNGRPATMLSGGEFPIIVPQALGAFSIEWKKFGVEMEAVPLILGAGRLRLEVMPSVSERDFANSTTVNGTSVPALQTRNVNTQVEMRFGETLMLAGLLSTRQIGKTSKIPLLGELPWVGPFFRNVRYEDVETELVIIITPQLVAPIAAHQMPAGGPGLFTTFPTDRELYLDGFLEIPNYGDPCSSCGGLGACGAGCPNYSAKPQLQVLPIQERTVPLSGYPGDVTDTRASAAGSRATETPGNSSKTQTKKNGNELPQTRVSVAKQVGYEETVGNSGRRATQSAYTQPAYGQPQRVQPQNGGGTPASTRTTRPTRSATNGLPGLIEP